MKNFTDVRSLKWALLGIWAVGHEAVQHDAHLAQAGEGVRALTLRLRGRGCRHAHDSRGRADGEDTREGIRGRPDPAP